MRWAFPFRLMAKCRKFQPNPRIGTTAEKTKDLATGERSTTASIWNSRPAERQTPTLGPALKPCGRAEPKRVAKSFYNPTATSHAGRAGAKPACWRRRPNLQRLLATRRTAMKSAE